MVSRMLRGSEGAERSIMPPGGRGGKKAKAMFLLTLTATTRVCPG